MSSICQEKWIERRMFQNANQTCQHSFSSNYYRMYLWKRWTWILRNKVRICLYVCLRVWISSYIDNLTTIYVSLNFIIFYFEIKSLKNGFFFIDLICYVIVCKNGTRCVLYLLLLEWNGLCWYELHIFVICWYKKCFLNIIQHHSLKRNMLKLL